METTQPISKLIWRLWYHLDRRRRLQFWLLLILMILSSFAEVLSIGAVLPFLAALSEPNRIFEHPTAQPFIEILGLNSAEQILLPLTIAFCLAAFMAGTMRISLLWVSTRVSFAAGSDLSNKAYHRTLYQPYEIHISRNSSEMINGIWLKISEVIFFILTPVLTFISASVMVTAIIIALLAIIPGIALATFGGFGLIYFFILKITRNRLKIESQCIARESTNVIKALQEGLCGIRDVLIDGSQKSFCDSYRNINHLLRRAQGNNLLISQSPRYGMEVLGMILIATIAYMLSRQPGGISGVIPVLAALALGLQRLLPALQQAYGSWSTIQGAQSSLQDTLGLLDQPLPDYVKKSPGTPLPFQKQISLKQISFQYKPESPWVLKNFNLTITKGSRVGFIGSTGCGKSTLLDIIMGLLQPTHGTIEIDNQPITTINQHSWQAHIAHVPQAVYLADNSIEENIAFGVPKEQIDSGRVRLAAQQAQIADIIESWPAKYQTFVGERGVQLSGGQLQRIGIARALYKQADVLIFDEATSALDTETEQDVMNAIESLSEDYTILIIAHRLNTLQSCTDIVKLGSENSMNVV